MRPLPFVWPYWPVFWIIWLWAFLPEFRIVNAAQKGAKSAGSKDAGSTRFIVMGGGVASLAAFAFAWRPIMQMPAAWHVPFLFLGIATLVAGSLLRRYCWRLLGESFTGDVRARADQAIVTSGAYALLRHPSYTAGILMNVGMGLALGSWLSTLLLAAAALVVYLYRMRVEERALVAAVGEPYLAFMRTRKRIIPFVY